MISKKEIKEEKLVGWMLFGYSAILLFFCSALSPFYPFNDSPDVNVYFNMGKAMMDGQVLYKDIFDHKGPFVFLLYGLASLLTSSSFWSVYLIQIVFLLATLWFTYKIGRLYMKTIPALFGAIVFSFFILLYNGKGGSTEELALPFMLVSSYFFLKYCKKGGAHDPFWMLIHGAMISYVFLLRLDLLAFWFFVPATFIYLLIKGEFHLAVRNLLTLFLGGFLIGFPTFLYFYFTNSLYDFHHAYIEVNLLYANSQLNWQEFFAMLGSGFLTMVKTKYVLMLFILIGLAVVVGTKFFTTSRGLRLIILLNFIVVFIAVYIAPHVFNYYCLPFSVFAILGITATIYWLSEKTHVPLPQKMNGKTAAVSLLLSMVVVVAGYLVKKTELADMPQDFIAEFAAEIEKEPRGKQTLLTLGLDEGVSIFTKIGIVPTVKYFFTPNIKKEAYSAISDAQRAYIENRAVSFVVVSDKYRDYSILLPYLEGNYETIKTHPTGGQVYYLYKRK